MNSLKMFNLSFFSSIKFSPKEIAKIIDFLTIEKSGNLDIAGSNAVYIAAVKLKLKRYINLADYIGDMNRYFEDAVNKRAQMIVFPEYTGLLPFSLMPEYENMLNECAANKDDDINIEAFNSHLAFFSNCVYEIYYNTMSLLAEKYEVYVMAGSTLFFEETKLCHKSFLFSPDGDLAGSQDKLSLNKLEFQLDVYQGSEVLVFDTKIGKISMLAGSDSEYFEPAKIAGKNGAQIIVNPTCFTGEDYTPADTAGGINLRVQENCSFYGVKSMLAGSTGLGMSLTGLSEFFAPAVLTKNRNGILAQGTGAGSDEVLVSCLNLDLLDEIKVKRDKNNIFLEKNYDKLY